MADEKKKGDETAAKSAADEARERAQKQREAQAATVSANATATSADVARADEGDKVAPAKDELSGGEQVTNLSPEEVSKLLSRLAALETLVAGSRGLEGPEADATKSTAILAASAVNAPQNALRNGSVTSAPNGQPIAKGYDPGNVNLAAKSAADRQFVEGVRVLLLAPHYIGDVVRNEGEVLEDYSGPLSSRMAVVDDRGNLVQAAA